MEVLDRPVLVLNKHYLAVRVSDFRRQLRKVQNERAKFLDPLTYLQYNWEEWLDEFTTTEKDENFNYINGKDYYVRMPEISVCSNYSSIPKSKVKLTRRNLLIRDNYTCQFTKKRVSASNATIDHVIPRSKGGKNTWENLVIASLEANTRKGDKTLEESGMKLLRKPVEPKWNPIYSFMLTNKPKSWENFVNTDKWNEVGYWDTELSD